MYLHQPTGEYRLLLLNKVQIDCYVFALGSDQPPRHIGAQAPPSSLSCGSIGQSALARDSLHWYPAEQSELVLVFDTISELLWHMRAPLVSRKSYIFETDGTLGIYSCDHAIKFVDIWVLQNYESEIWDCKYRVELPLARIRGELGVWRALWNVRVASGDSDILVMVTYSQCLCCVDTDGKLVASFHGDGQDLHACQRRLKQTLVQHTFFTALEGYAVNAPPFI
jgi:hypothetical protein